MKPEILLEHAAFVRNLARSLVADENVARDVTQQTWLAALESRPDPERPLRSWLARVLRNVILMNRRSEARRRRRERLAAGLPAVPSPDRIAEREEHRRIMVDAVLGLEEPYREAILLRYYEDAPPRKIAATLGLPVETVRTRLKRGLVKLRKRLEEGHGSKREWRFALASLGGLEPGRKTLPLKAGSGAASAVSGGLIMATKFKVGIVFAGALLVSVFAVMTLTNPDPDADDGREASPVAGETSGLMDRDIDPVQDEGPEDSDDPVGVEQIVVRPSLQVVHVFGRVVSKTDGKPVAKARIALNKMPYEEEIEETTLRSDDTGRFEGDLSVPEETSLVGLDVAISSGGYRDHVSYRPLLFAKGLADCGTIELETNERYSVCVVDERGVPVENARVEFFKECTSDPVATRTTGPDGKVFVSEQEIIRGRGLFDEVGLRVMAPGMADCYWQKGFGEELEDGRPFPEVVTLEPPGQWTGRVVDDDDGSGIAGALVRLKPSMMVFLPFLERRMARTDGSGRFTMDRLTGFGCRAISLEITASGYGKYRERNGPFPSLISLTRREAQTIPCLALNTASGEPLRNAKLIDSRCREYVTDGYGRFPFVVRYGRIHSVKMMTAKRDMWFFGKPEKEEKHGDLYVLSLSELGIGRFLVRVRDALGRPVRGAKVTLSRGRVSGDRFTDSAGIARFDAEVTKGSCIRFIVTHREFCAFTSESIEIGGRSGEDASDEHEFAFTLQRAYRCGAIRVLDESGAPDAGVKVIAELLIGDEPTRRLFAASNGNGECVMHFPPFDSGTMHVYQRPDTAIDIDYGSVLSGDWITVIHYGDAVPENSIEGIVVDGAGVPVRGIVVRPKEMNGAGTYYNPVRTKADGRFRVPVYGDRTYRVSFSGTMVDGVKYVAEDETQVTAGVSLLVTMKRLKGVRIDLFPLRRKEYLLREGYEAWLQSEDDTVVNAVIRESDTRKIIYTDIPDGAMRAILRTRDDAVYLSGLFTVADGKCGENVVIDSTMR